MNTTPSPSIGTSASSSNIAAQNGLIIQLVRSSESALRSGQRWQYQSTERLRKLEKAAMKLQVAQRELATQATTCAGMVTELANGCANLDSEAQTLQREYEARSSELQSQLDALARQTISPCLTSGQVSAMSPLTRSATGTMTVMDQQTEQTLFDFVDLESVRALQTNHLQSMSQLAQASEQARNALLQPCQLQLEAIRKMEEELREAMGTGTTNTTGQSQNIDGTASSNMVDTTSNSNATNDPSAPSSALLQATQSHAALEHEVSELSRLFADLCSAYDRVRSAALEQQGQPAAPGSAQPATTSSSSGGSFDLQGEITQMQSIERLMSTLATRAATLAQEVESCSGTQGQLYSRTLELFHTLSAFGPSLKTALASFQSVKSQTDAIIDSARASITEIHNLKLWYIQFEKSYFALLEEIQRRHRQLAHVQAFISTVGQQLQEWFQEENDARGSFENLFGRYLPPSLCPARGEAVQSVQIVPELLQTHLPVFVPTEEEQRMIAEVLYSGHQQQHQQQSDQQHSGTGSGSDSGSGSNQPMQTTTHPASLEGSNQSVSTLATESTAMAVGSPMGGQQVDHHMQDVGVALGQFQDPALQQQQQLPSLQQLQSSFHHETLKPPVSTSGATYPIHTPSPPPNVQLQQLSAHLSRVQQSYAAKQLSYDHHSQQQQVLAPTPMQAGRYASAPPQQHRQHSGYMAPPPVHAHTGSACFSHPPEQHQGFSGAPMQPVYGSHQQQPLQHVSYQQQQQSHSQPQHHGEPLQSSQTHQRPNDRQRAWSHSKPNVPRGFSDDD